MPCTGFAGRRTVEENLPVADVVFPRLEAAEGKRKGAKQRVGVCGGSGVDVCT